MQTPLYWPDRQGLGVLWSKPRCRWSNETYVAADGARYEKVGIPPDVPAELDPAGFAADRDSMLTAARDYLNTAASADY